MENATSQQQASEQGPTLCVAGCGFYGSPDTSGLCSVCHKAQQSRQTAALAAPSPSPQPAAPVAAPAPAAAPEAALKLDEVPPQQQPAAEEASAAEVSAAAADPVEPADEQPKQANRSRCFCCRKKVGLLGFECRCGFVFCSSHRHARDHACTFDYAAFDKANLAKANNKVVAAKVDKL